MAVYAEFNGERIELNGAAEEATMREILRAIEKSGSSGGAAAGGAAGGVVGSIVGLGKSINPLNMAFSALGKTLGLVTGAFTGIVKLGAGAVGMGVKLVDTQPKITDFSNALTNLPGILGDMGSAVHAVTTLLYKNFTTFQQLTTSGIAFGDRLTEMSAYGARVGTSLDAVAGNLAANSESLARLGTGSRGASKAIEAMSQAFALNSEELQRYGLNFEEQNETFMRFFSQNSLAMARGTMSQQQVVALSDDYAKGLRRLSELTGIQADQLQEGVDKANMNRAFENFLSTMDGETANRMRSILNTVQAGFGDAGREAAMATMMGIAPVTDSAANMMTMNRGFGQMLRGVTSSAQNFNGTLDQFNNNLYGQINQFANANRGYADANSRLFAALDMTGDPFGQAGGQLIAGINMFSGSIAEVESRLGRSSPLQDAFVAFNEAITNVRTAFADLFVRVLDSQAFKNALTTLESKLPGMATAVENFLVQVEAFFGDMGTAEGRAKRWDDITQWFKDLLKEMVTYLQTAVVDGVTGGGSQTISSIESGSTISQGFLQTVLGGGAGIDAEKLLGQAERNQAGAGTGSFMDRYGFLGLGGGYQSYLQQVMEEAMESGQYANEQEARSAILQALQTYATNQKEAGIYSQDQLQQVLNFLQDDVQETLQGITTRSLGTFGATGRIVEPSDTLARIHAGERVLNPQEAAAYNADPSTAPVGTANLPSGLAQLTQKMVDSNREHSVNLLEALNTLVKRMDTQNNLTKQVITAVETY